MGKAKSGAWGSKPKTRSADPIAKHVEMYDGLVFCGIADHGDLIAYDGVQQRDWHKDPNAVAGSDCRGCLEAIHALGMAAMERLGAPGFAGSHERPPPAVPEMNKARRARRSYRPT